MPVLHLILVALIQGVTEFLPVSSSGHLILLPKLTGLADQGQVIDVAVHVGTLFAVVLYFKKDSVRALAGLFTLARGNTSTDDARLALCLIFATIPIVIVGLVINLTGASDGLRSITVIGWATLLFGLLLFWADRIGAQDKTGEDWTTRNAWIMGAWQVLALIPGTSRSGITITGARLLGYKREEAARLAMLMSIPTIIAAGSLLGFQVARDANAALATDAFVVAVLAFLAALAAIHFMMRLLRVVSFTPYVVYRIILGITLLTIAYS